MSDVAEKKLSKAKAVELRKLRLEAMNLQDIEDNPLDAEDIAMFEMFEREGWDDERCRSYILARKAPTHAARESSGAWRTDRSRGRRVTVVPRERCGP